jgi:maltooligosyltrehalose trehalohydrolase
VRRYFIENALYWITDCHIDALRLDAVHAIVDHSASPFLEELAAAVYEQAGRLHRRAYVIAESDLDDTRIIRPRELGGYGHDAQWSDSFHHALHTLLTGERDGYYADFGQVGHLAKAFAEGYVYSGQYSVFRQRRHGHSSRHRPAHQFVVCAQNHDQVGNRLLGERLTQLTSFEGLKLAATVVLLSPFIPLLFMGEEYGETAPFPYFISHSDAALVAAVRQGRQEEFAGFHRQAAPLDPQDEATFLSAKLNHHLRQQGHHTILQALYCELVQLRQTLPSLARLDKDSLEVHAYEKAQVLSLRRWCEGEEALLVFHFGASPITVTLPVPAGQWQKRFDTTDVQWHGPGSPLAAVLTTDGEAPITLPRQAGLLFVRSQPTPGRH